MGNVCSARKDVGQKVDASQAQRAGETLPLLHADEFNDKESPARDDLSGYGAMPVDERWRDGDKDSKRSSRRGGGSKRRDHGKDDDRSTKGKSRGGEDNGRGPGGRGRDRDDRSGAAGKKKKPEKVSSRWKVIFKMTPYLFFVYLLVSIVALQRYFTHEVHFKTTVDCVYFVFITVLTIGYGDLFPETDGGKIYVMVFILVGVCIGSVFLGYVAEWVIGAQERAIELLAAKQEAGVRRDLKSLRAVIGNNANGGRGEERARRDSCASWLSDEEDEDERTSWKVDVPPAASNPVLKAAFIVVFFTIAGAVGMMHFEKLKPLDGFYWAVVTVTTVGYGDISPVTDAGKIFTCVYATVAVATVAWAMSTITESYISGAVNSNAEDVLNTQRLTPEYLMQMGGPKVRAGAG